MKRRSKNNFDEEKNTALIVGQHKLDDVLHILRRKNGIECYDSDRRRTTKVVRHYIKRFKLDGTIVERFWYFYGVSILIGKMV